MEVVDFSKTEFQDIPEQDNPAFDKKECLMLVPDPVESVNHVAIVWKQEIAEAICNYLNKISE